MTARAFPAIPTDDVLAELIRELSQTLTLFGRSTADAPGPEAQLLEPAHPALGSVAEMLVNAHLNFQPYMPGAEPEVVPTEWRSLRSHKLQREGGSNSLFYEAVEYLPDVAKFEASSSANEEDYRSELEGTFSKLADGLKHTLGKPRTKQKRRVEFEWTGANGSGRIEVALHASSGIEYGGDEPAPWDSRRLTISMSGSPPSPRT
jgi:hypothetical protein